LTLVKAFNLYLSNMIFQICCICQCHHISIRDRCNVKVQSSRFNY